VKDEVLPGDLDPGDVIILPGAGDELLVKAIRLGQGGFILTVSPAGDAPGTQRIITLTAATPLRKRRRVAPGLQVRLWRCPGGRFGAEPAQAGESREAPRVTIPHAGLMPRDLRLYPRLIRRSYGDRVRRGISPASAAYAKDGE
jgi:hypothetical protein